MLQEELIRANPIVLDDVEIDYWAHVYVRLDLLGKGYTFEAFLHATPAVREEAARLAKIASRPQTTLGNLVSPTMLARHVDLSSKDLQALREGMRSSVVTGNGRRIEKMRHHRFPRSSPSFRKADA